MVRDDIAWAAGLFEGEGSVILTTNRSHRWVQPRVQVASTDLDVLERFRDAVGFGSVTGPRENGPRGRKLIYRWSGSGFRQSQALIAMFWPWLGTRRKAKARVVLLATRERKQRMKVVA